MRWSTSAALVVMTAALTGCTTTTSIGPSAGPPTADRVRDLVDAAPFELDTHCGIDELMFRGKYYVRVGGPLDDGQGNPPAGWDNPSQRGGLVVYTTYAVFSDAKGHVVRFTIRPGATGFEKACS